MAVFISESDTPLLVFQYPMIELISESVITLQVPPSPLIEQEVITLVHIPDWQVYPILQLS